MDDQRMPESIDVDVLVVGAGFSGLYSLYRLRAMGLRAVAIDGADDVGGTWWWNRYPGARCDIRSLDYSFSFDEQLEQDWTWSEKYATQPEILAYADHIADRFDLRRDIRFRTRLTDATWEDDSATWRSHTDRADLITSRHLIMAVGALSAAKRPEIDGIDDFEGLVIHTGHWPHGGVDLTDRRVAVIGTGSSGIQCIPLIAERAAHLTVYQRTANFSVPACNGTIDPEVVAEIKRHYRDHRAAQRESFGGVVGPAPEKSVFEVDHDERIATFDRIWEEGMLFGFLGSYNDVMIDENANSVVADYLRDRIRSIVRDPVTAETLCPTGYPLGAKRLCLDTGYYETFNRENVDLVDLQRTPIVRITSEGIETTEGDEPFDVIVFATGFDAMTGPLLGPQIIGRDGLTLRDAWVAGPRTYLGIMVHGFPNMFTVTGPGSPSVMTNMLVSIEQHVEWLTDFIAWLDRNDHRASEPTIEAQDDWVEQVNALAEFTLYPKGNSWYLGANVPGKPRVFMPYIGGVGTYRAICDDVAANDYRGFEFTD